MDEMGISRRQIRLQAIYERNAEKAREYEQAGNEGMAELYWRYADRAHESMCRLQYNEHVNP